MKIKNVLSTTFVFACFYLFAPSSTSLANVEVGDLWQRLRSIEGCRVKGTLYKNLSTGEVTGQKTVSVKNCGEYEKEDLIEDFTNDKESPYMQLDFVGNENWGSEAEKEDNSSAPSPSIPLVVW